MSPLQPELQRLYGWASPAAVLAAVLGTPSTEPADPVRCLVVALTRSPRWQDLEPLWRGVQSELGLPAPAIAVAGAAGLQLWFSLAEPVAVQQALVFMDALRTRFLPDVRADRVHCGFCGGLRGEGLAEAGMHDPAAEVVPVPALLDESGRWSSFVAADLVAVFDDTPWLDVKPSEEGQATLLRGLATTQRSAFEQACQVLGLPAVPAPVMPDSRAPQATAVSTPPAAGLSLVFTAQDDPRRFLLQVMNDNNVALALRIEAAKALLQHTPEPASPRHGD